MAGPLPTPPGQPSSTRQHLSISMTTPPYLSHPDILCSFSPNWRSQRKLLKIRSDLQSTLLQTLPWLPITLRIKPSLLSGLTIPLWLDLASFPSRPATPGSLQLPDSRLCVCYSLCSEHCSFPQMDEGHRASSLTSFRSSPKCQLPSEAFPDCPI